MSQRAIPAARRAALGLALTTGCLPWGKATSCDAQDWFADQDGDGFGSADDVVTECTRPDGFVAGNSDCDDSNNAISPAETEICDLIDNNCDGHVDVDALDASTWYEDADGDGYGSSAGMLISCESDGYVDNANDCDDSDASVAPEQAEICGDSIDQDCSGEADEQYSMCAESPLECSEDMFECIESDTRNSTCMCGCSDHEMLIWEIEGILADSYTSDLRGAMFQFETAAGTSGWVTCPDELLNLPEEILPHVFEVYDLYIHVSMPCTDDLGALGQWYTNYYDGFMDRRSGSIIYKKYDPESSSEDDLWTWPEEFRWNFYESLLIEYSPMPPCTGTSELTIYAEKAEPA